MFAQARARYPGEASPAGWVGEWLKESKRTALGRLDCRGAAVPPFFPAVLGKFVSSAGSLASGASSLHPNPHPTPGSQAQGWLAGWLARLGTAHPGHRLQAEQSCTAQRGPGEKFGGVATARRLCARAGREVAPWGLEMGCGGTLGWKP